MNKTETYTLITISLLLGFIIVFSYPYFLGWDISDDDRNWASYGSFLGGLLGPFFSFMSFIGILITLNLQSKQNNRNVIISMITKQLELHNQNLNNVKFERHLKSNTKVETRTYHGINAFHYLFEKELKSFYKSVKHSNSNQDEKEIINLAFDKLYKKEGKSFGFYFRNLYYIFHTIDNAKNIDQIYYAKLVRAQLSIPELQLLMYNCLYEKGGDFKIYAEKYFLLNGLDDDLLLTIEHKNLFTTAFSIYSGESGQVILD
ncbi:putative phage abortive infection protein [Myroides sp. LJL115]